MATEEERRAYFEALEAPFIPYYVALGKFLSAYALVEANAHYILRESADVTPEVARSIFSGTRVTAALEYIRRIGEAENWSDARWKHLNIVNEQLGEVTRVRNDILHHGSTLTGVAGEWLTTNAIVAHIQKKIRATRITPTILDDLTNDCYKIAAHITLIGSEDDFGQDILEPLLAASWRYKREQPVLPQEIPRSPRPRRTHPPESSDGKS